jgi:hypothetical protein
MKAGEKYQVDGSAFREAFPSHLRGWGVSTYKNEEHAFLSFHAGFVQVEHRQMADVYVISRHE